MGVATMRLEPVVEELLADVETPVTAFAKLRGLGPAFLLESAEGGERFGRYSFIGVLPRATLTFVAGAATVRTAHEERVVPYEDPLSVLRNELAPYARAASPGLPRFSGGAVGYVGYEAARRFERLPSPSRDPHGLPEAHFAIYDTVVAFDHLRHAMALITHEDAEQPGGARRSRDLVRAALAERVDLPTGDPVARTVTANGTPAEFRARVARARELIAEGDCIQIVLAQRFDISPAPDALSLYRALRHVNPSPYMFCLDAGEVTLVGASPEPFVRVEGRRVVMHPIAGTRPRGASTREDERLERELVASEKERAEHVMLVDLARNDLGRVAAPGTVTVRELMRVDRFSHVMHLTSIVDAELARGVDALDAFRACFPAGTVSGAPKIRAMERIAELEPDARGTYAGAVGYLSFDGSLDTCITIRTAQLANGVCSVQAGAGIVADSDPVAEEAETRAKARALLRAIEVVDTVEAR